MINVEEIKQKLEESEEKYRALFKNSPFAIGLVDMNGIIIDINNYHETNGGYKKEDFIGKKFIELGVIPKDYMPIVISGFKDLVKGKNPGPKEIQLFNKYGDLIWVNMQCSLIKIGKKTLIQVITQDITEKKEAEIRLKESEEKYHGFVNNISDIIFELDIKGKCLYVSHQLLGISGFNSEEMIGQNVFEYVHPDDLSKVAEKVKESFIVGGSHSLEFRLRHKDRNYVSISSKFNTINVDGHQKLTGVLRDITEKKIVEQKLKDSEEKSRLILENANDMIAVINDRFEYEYINEPVFMKILGYSNDDLIGKRNLPLIHPEDRKKAVIAASKILRKGSGFHQLRFQHKNGDYKWIEITGGIFYNNKGEKKILDVYRDITERKNIEELMKDQVKKFRILNKIIRISSNAEELDVLLSATLNSTLELMDFDGGGIYLLGDTENEAELQCHKGLESDFVDKVKHIEINKSPRDIIFLKGEPIFAENYPEIDPENSLKWGILSLASIPLFGKDKVIGAINIASKRRYIFSTQEKDILQSIGRELGTVIAKFRAENDFIESEEKYRFITENANDLITILNKNYVHEYINEQAYLNLLGYNKEDILGKTPLFLLHPDDIEKTTKALEEGFMKGEGQIEYRIRHKNGQYYWLESKGKKLFDEKGQEKGIIITRDITKRKLIEQKLIESEDKFRTAVENSPDFIVFIKADGTILEVNRLEKGYTREMVIGQSVFNKNFYETKDQCESARKAIRDSIETGEKTQYEYSQIAPDGSLSFYEAIVAPFGFDKEEKIVSFQLVTRDITERKKVEQKLIESEEHLKKLNFELEQRIEERTKELKESEEHLKKLNETIKSEKIKLEEIMNNTIDGISTIDMQGNVIHSNKAFANLIGYESEKQILGMNMEKFTIKDDVPKVISAMKNGFKEGFIRNFEVVGVTKEGKNYNASINAKLIKDENGIFQWLGVIRDVTEKKTLEQKLKELNQELEQKVNERTKKLIKSEGRFKYLVSSNPAIIFTAKPSGGYGATFISENVKDLTGYIPEEFTDDSNFWLDHIHPEDKDRVLTDLSELHEKGHIIHEYRFQFKGGSYHWMRDELKLVRDENGNAKELIGFWIDITDRKNAEQKLKESEEKCRGFFNYMSSGAAIYEDHNDGEDFIFKDFNLAAEKIEKIKKEELIGKKVTDVFPGVKDFGLFEVFQRVWKTGKPKSHPISLYQDQRIIGWRENYVYRLPTGEIVALYDDITKRKQAELKLKESEEKFRTITEQSLVGIAIVQDFVFKYINQKFADISGYAVEELMDLGPKKFAKLVHPKDRLWIMDQAAKKQIGDENVILSYQYRGISKIGEVKWIENYSKTINYEGRLADLVIITDITEKKKAEEELMRINKLKSEIFTRASHELKTPLIAIKGYTDLLLELHRDEIDGMVLSSLNQIRRGCNIFEKTINDILNTTYLESDQVKLNLSREDLSFLIKYCVSDLKGYTLTRNHEITIDVHDKLITTFEKEKIYEVLSNLIINAIKYTPPGGKIKVKSEITDNFYKISIKDNGIGFTDKEKEEAFKQFGKIERYGQGWDVGIEGTGLGLYISKKIIELHGGKIWMESKGRNKGSIFSFTLPIS